MIKNSDIYPCIIVGGGIAGLMAATYLKTYHIDSLIIDKGRGIGGRMATRRISAEGIGEGIVDYGAQYFTVKSQRFFDSIKHLIDTEFIVKWPLSKSSGNFQLQFRSRYIGKTGIRSIAKYLGTDLHVIQNEKVNRLECGSHWIASTDKGNIYQGQTLLLTAPLPQNLQLLAENNISLPVETRQQLELIEYDRCIALLGILDRPTQILEPGALQLSDSILSWVADNKKKGISPEVTTITLHAAADFSEEYWAANDHDIAVYMLEESKKWINKKSLNFQIHRWRYSKPRSLYADPFYHLPTPAPLLMAGDAFGGARVEAAALSGLSAADRLREILYRS